MRAALLALLLCGLSAGAAELPKNVTLASGTVLSGVSVVRWEKDVVVLKHRGGVDPIRYDRISPEQRKLFEAVKDERVALQTRIRDAINEQALVVGMTPEQAKLSWGAPKKINRSSGDRGSHEQWIYPGPVYVYFRNGLLTSWQYEKKTDKE